jgi:hypothetical protein
LRVLAEQGRHHGIGLLAAQFWGCCEQAIGAMAELGIAIPGGGRSAGVSAAARVTSSSLLLRFPNGIF